MSISDVYKRQHVGRRMGVVLCYGEKGDDLNQLRDKAKRLAKTVLGTDPYMKKRMRVWSSFSASSIL